MRGQTKPLQFYLSIVEYIKQHHTIPEWLGSKQLRNYHTKSLREQGVIVKKGYGVWGVVWDKWEHYSKVKVKQTSDKKVKQTSDGTNVGIRGHGYQFSISIPQKISSWAVYLGRSNIPYKIGYNNIPKAILLGNKVWFCHNSIIIYYPEHKSFYAEDAESSENKAIYHLRRVISLLEHRLGVSLRIGKEYLFTVDKAHYAEIENDLARQLNRDKEKLHVVGQDGKTWLIADFSDSVNELETVHAQKSKEDMDKIITPFMNDLRNFFYKTGEIIRPSELMEMIHQLIQSHAYFAKNNESHVASIREIRESNRQLVHYLHLLNAREERFRAAQLQKEQRKLNDYP